MTQTLEIQFEILTGMPNPGCTGAGDDTAPIAVHQGPGRSSALDLAGCGPRTGWLGDTGARPVPHPATPWATVTRTLRPAHPVRRAFCPERQNAGAPVSARGDEEAARVATGACASNCPAGYGQRHLLVAAGQPRASFAPQDFSSSQGD